MVMVCCHWVTTLPCVRTRGYSLSAPAPWGLPLGGVQPNADVPAPFPRAVAVVRHDARRDDGAPDGPPAAVRRRVIRHANSGVVRTYKVDAAVPHAAAAPRPTEAAVGVGNQHTAIKNSCLRHFLYPFCGLRLSAPTCNKICRAACCCVVYPHRHNQCRCRQRSQYLHQRQCPSYHP